TLLGEGDADFSRLLPSRLQQGQMVYAGVRDIDPGERRRLDQGDIPVITVESIRAAPTTVVDALRARGARNIYVHLDLDVLDPSEGIEVNCPVRDGLTISELTASLEAIGAAFNVVGVALTELAASDANRCEQLEAVIASANNCLVSD